MKKNYKFVLLLIVVILLVVINIPLSQATKIITKTIKTKTTTPSSLSSSNTDIDVYNDESSNSGYIDYEDGDIESSGGSSSTMNPDTIPTNGLLNATTTVYFSGGTLDCLSVSSCPTSYPYAYAEDYACSFNKPPRGNWSGGIKYFEDPLPINTERSQIKGIQFKVLGAFGCDNSLFSTPSTKFQLFIQDAFLFTYSIDFTENDQQCTCGSCYLEYETLVYQYTTINLSYYNISGTNKFQIYVIQNDICSTSVDIIFYYESPPLPPITPSPTPPSPYSGFLSSQVKKYIIIASSITGGLLISIFTFVFIRSKLNSKRSGYIQIKDGKDINIQQIKIGVRIGKGNFGEVFLGTWRGSQVAVKKLPVHNINENVLKEFHREIDLMKNLRHPNVLQFLGSCSIPPDICICTEYMPRGSLYSILHNESVSVSWSLIKRMMIDASKGIIYLHGSNPVILHRDLKSHNLLVDENWKVKVADFGLSTIEQQGATMTACGTPCWTSPEVLRSQRYTEKADVYSFGIILWECATRQDPYFGIPPFQVIFAVGREGLRPPVPKLGPPQYIRLIIDCLNENPSNRPTMEECLERLESIDTTGFGDIIISNPQDNILIN